MHISELLKYVIIFFGIFLPTSIATVIGCPF